MFGAGGGLCGAARESRGQPAPGGLGLAEFAIAHGAPRSLEALGFSSNHIADAAALALRTPVANPRPIALGDVEAMLRHAHAGDLAGWNSVASA